MKSTRGSNVKIRPSFINDRLVSIPARIGRVHRGQKGASEFEVLREDEAETKTDVLTVIGKVGAGSGGAPRELAEDGKVKRAFSGGGGGGGEGDYGEKKEKGTGRNGHRN